MEIVLNKVLVHLHFILASHFHQGLFSKILKGLVGPLKRTYIADYVDTQNNYLIRKHKNKTKYSRNNKMAPPLYLNS